MRMFLALLPVCLLAFRPAVAQEAGSTLGLETALGYSVSYHIVEGVMDVVEAAHVYYQQHGSWPADSTAFAEFVDSDTSVAVGFEKYDRLGLLSLGGDQVQIVFQFAPYETVIEEEGTYGIPLSVHRAAGAIELDPIAEDSSRVIVHMDELEYSGGPDLSVDGDLGGAEMEFEYIGEDQ